jgi:hypothetical protein
MGHGCLKVPVPSMTSEAQRLREQAARCLRLAQGTHANDVRQQLRNLAAEYLEKAEALEDGANQQQQQVGTMPPPSPVPSQGVAQQQQQAQPKKADDTE